MAENAGLTEVYRGEDPVVECVNFHSYTPYTRKVLKLSSIVAIHGLNGHPIKTWTTHETKRFWLGDSDLLPSNLKRARILTYGYNASVAALLGKTSSDRIMQHAQTLIAELVADREVRLEVQLLDEMLILGSLKTQRRGQLYLSAIRLVASSSKE
jgi:hypothetical protein